MLDKVLSVKLKEYAPANQLEQENVLQELLQLYILTTLSHTDFFENAMFHGGTCLHLFYGMNRFSEDLDFILKKADSGFRWQQFLVVVQKECEQEGISFEMHDKSRVGIAVQKALLKTDS